MCEVHRRLCYYRAEDALTFSGTESLMATSLGTPTSLMSRLGSGEMTVRAEKSTRLPERLLLNRPSLPFRRCESVFSALPLRCLAGGMPEASLLKYVVT